MWVQCNALPHVFQRETTCVTFFLFPLMTNCTEKGSGHREFASGEQLRSFNPVALRMAKTLWSSGHPECSRVRS